MVQSPFCSNSKRIAVPIRRAVDHLPEHVLGGLKVEYLYVEATRTEAELEHAAAFAFALRGGRPFGDDDLMPTLCRISGMFGTSSWCLLVVRQT